jgi:hypothetical protein
LIVTTNALLGEAEDLGTVPLTVTAFQEISFLASPGEQLEYCVVNEWMTA